MRQTLTHTVRKTSFLRLLLRVLRARRRKKRFLIYAKKMGEKYLKRYKKYFRDPEIREFDMQHEQWLLGGERYAAPVLKSIDEFMETP